MVGKRFFMFAACFISSLSCSILALGKCFETISRYGCYGVNLNLLRRCNPWFWAHSPSSRGCASASRNRWTAVASGA